MALTSYERLRMTHRALPQQHSSVPDSKKLLAELPAILKRIAAERPALKDEVEVVRHSLRPIAAYVDATLAVDNRRVAQALYQTLSPLFPGQ